MGNSKRGCVISRYIYILSTKFYGKKEKEQHEDKFKLCKVTAISKLVNKCIEPFAIKIVKFIVCWLKNIPFVVFEVWNIVKNMMSGKKKSNYSGIKCLLLSYQYICLSLPDYFTLDESIYKMANKKMVLTHKRMCYCNRVSKIKPEKTA